jgi:hypothetical protein
VPGYSHSPLAASSVGQLSGCFGFCFEDLSRRMIQFNSDIQTNFTFVDSNVVIPEDQALLLTTKERPLVGQFRYIYNII